MKESFKNVYENVKKGIAEKWEGFKKKFEGAKSEMSQEVLSAKSPEDLIALGKKMQEQGEALKLEEEGVKNEEGYEADHSEALEENENIKQEKMEKDHGEALEENKAFDEAKIAKEEKEAAERKAELAEEIRLFAEADAKKADELLKKIQNGEIGEGKMENGEFANDGQQEVLIEKIGAPKNEMFEKYGNKMREAADELVLNREKMIENEKELKKNEHGSEKWKKLWNENRALNDRRNELSSDASWGNGVIKDPGQKYGESYAEYSNKRSSTLEKYQKTAMDDPYVVLRMIEAGELGGNANGDGLGKVSERLLENPEFIKETIALAQKHENGAYSGWFWKNVKGEARANKDLFVEAVKLNYLNYQFGSNEWKSDPAIQKVALESGLDSTYLYKE